MVLTNLTEKKSRRADLAGLRGLALLLVLLYHFDIRPFSGGFIGVDVFFVLSGYLISGNIKRSLELSKFSLSTFYTRRITRLAPALFVTLIISNVVSLAVLPTLDVRDAAQSAAAATLGASNVDFFFRSGYFDTAAARKPLLHTWSLGVETQFYMLWAPLHSVLYAVDPVLPATFAAIFTAIGMAFAEQVAIHNPNAGFYLPHHRAWEFLIGTVVAIHTLPKSLVFSTRLADVLSLIGLTALLTAAATFHPRDVFPGVRAIVPCLSTAALISTPGSKVARFFLSGNLLGFLGNISYSVYLVHWPLLIHIRSIRLWTPLTPVERSVGFLSSLVGGYALHFLIERPLMARREFGNARMFFLKFFALVTALVAAFLLLAFTFDEKAKHALNNVMDDLTSFRGASLQFGGINASEVVGLAKRSISPKNFSKKKVGKLGNEMIFKPVNRPALRVAIIGDSHASSLQPLAVHLVETLGANVHIWSRYTCPPILGIVKIFLLKPAMDKVCREFNAMWRERVAKEEFDAVILAARWEGSLPNHGYGKHTVTLFIQPGESREDSIRRGLSFGKNHSKSIFGPALKATAKMIADTGATPILFSQVPLLPFDLRVCKTGKHCNGPSRATVMERFKFIDDVIRSAANGVGVAKAVILSKYFCDEAAKGSAKGDTCRVTMGGALLYHDENHLSALGSAYFALRWQKDGYSGISWNKMIKNRAARDLNRISGK